jgi:hypothetical protein
MGEVSAVESSPVVKIGKRCPQNGKATVSFEIVMTEEEQREMVDLIRGGEIALDDREDLLDRIGVGCHLGAD